MDSAKLYQVILDQQEELTEMVGKDFVKREEVDDIRLDSKRAQVVIGVRRSGKSTLCHMALQNAGVKYGYVNFDDDRLASIAVEDLNGVLEAIYRVYGTDVKHLFFDEIQNVEGWHLFVNRLLRQGFKIVVTGSNAKLLSSELATHLTGRYHEIRLYPFSFREFCQFNGIETDHPSTRNIALVKDAFDRYMIEGGFPELEEHEGNEDYVNGLIDAILTKDIVKRFRIRNVSGLKTLANHLINNVAQIINVHDIVEKLGIGSDKTVKNYIEYLSQAFLISPLAKFSYKSIERLRDTKSYVVDNGMMTYRDGVLTTDNLGWRLENIVMIELLRRNVPLHRDIFYYRPDSRSKEVDFVVTNRGIVKELIQVSYDISNPKTFAREVSALVEASNKTGCKNLTLVTCADSRKIVEKGLEIYIESATEWLLKAPYRPE